MGATVGVTAEESTDSMIECSAKNLRANELWTAYGFCWNGKLYHRSNEGTEYCDQHLKLGDIVNIHLDMIKKQLSFQLNGKDLGVAFKDMDITKVYRLHVGLWSEETIEIVR